MKNEIHPQYHPVVCVDPSVGAEFITRSTMKSNETRDIDGVKHPLALVEGSTENTTLVRGLLAGCGTVG